eukprot:COSAG05_NODE_24536_length_251_cov_0.342105_1_plen_21_part_10
MDERENLIGAGGSLQGAFAPG